MLVWVRPVPCSLTWDAEVKFVPVSVTLTDEPSAPLEGAIDASVGRPPVALTVNGAVPLVPAVVVTEILRAPVAAVAAMTRVAVALVVLTTDTFETVMPLPALMVRGATKPVPVSVTGTEEP